MTLFTRSTTLQLAAVLLAVSSITTTLAQSNARQAVPAKRPVVAAKATTAAKPVAKESAAPVAQAQAPAAQSAVRETPAPAVASAQPASTSTRTEPKPARKLTLSGRNKYLNLGIGLLTYYGGGLPLGASFEADLKNNISVGGSVDYFRYNYGYYSGGYNFIYAGARASYHMAEILGVEDNKFDPYVGASLGFRHASYRDSYGNRYSDYGAGYNSGIFLGIHLGSRYMFSPKIGGFAEVGYGVSALKLGLTAKF